MRDLLLAAYCFAIGVAFWPGTAGASLSPRWALIGLVFAFLVRVEWPFWKLRSWSFVPITINVGHFLVVLLVAWSALTLAWSQFPYDGIDALAQLIFMAGVFFVGSSLKSLKPVYVGFALALGVSSMMAIAQYLFGWQGVHQVVSPAGLFINKNTMAEIGVLVLVGVTVERMWWAVPLACPAAILPMSKGALLALTGSALLIIRSNRLAMLALLGAGMVLVAYVDLNLWPQSILDRVAYWTDTLRNLNWLGHGIGSFNGLYPSFASTDTLHIRTDHVHNDYIEWMFEQGLVGTSLLLALVVVAVRNHKRPGALAVVCALGVEMLFAFPLHLPCTAFLGAMVLGHLCADGDRVWVNVAHGRRAVSARLKGERHRADRPGSDAVSVPALSPQRAGLHGDPAGAQPK